MNHGVVRCSMSRNPKIIDAEFEVIEPGDREPSDDGAWTFWHDDFPTLGGLAISFGLAYLLKLYVFH